MCDATGALGLPGSRGDDYRVDETTGCWVWLKAISGSGYAYKQWQGRLRRAHRLYYEIFVGPIPDGMTLDHACNNRQCVNPSHLAPATIKDNVARSEAVSTINRRKTHCDHGHEFTPANTRFRKNGSRRCVECTRRRTRETARRRRAKQRSARQASAASEQLRPT